MQQLLTFAEARRIMDDPMRDRSYQDITLLGPFIEPFLDYKAAAGLRPRSIETMRYNLARVALAIPDVAPEAATHHDINRALASFKQGSRRPVRSNVRELFQWLWLENVVTSNPVDKTPKPLPVRQKAVDVFSPEEMERLVTVPDQRDRPLMALMFYAGLRKGECRNLRFRHIATDPSGPDRFNVVVLDGKGGKDRIIPIPAWVVHLAAEVEVLDGCEPDDYVWYGTHDTTGGQFLGGPSDTRRWVTRSHPIASSTFARWWRRTLEAAGFDESTYRNPHVTRHSYATLWLRRGGAIEKLSENLGHSSVAVTHSTYAHLTVEDRRAEMERVFG